MKEISRAGGRVGGRLKTHRRLVVMALLLLTNTVPFQQPARCQTGYDFSQHEGKIIRKIGFSGKFKLKRSILYREIDSKPGKALNNKLIVRDQKKVDGLAIFSEVKPEVVDLGDSVDIDFRLTEVWTLLPLASLGRTDNSIDLMVGAHERDLLGWYLSVTGVYRRFENENSYFFNSVYPRALGRDISIALGLAHEKQKEPLRVDDATVEYRYLGKSVFVDVGVRAKDKVYPSAFFGYTRENWRLQASPNNPPGLMEEVDYPRYAMGAAVNLGRIYSDNYYFDGAMVSPSIVLIRELPGKSFKKWRIQIVGRAFLLSHGFNFCFRSQYLTSSADERMMPYSLSGDRNVRGFPDKYDRGDHFLGGNAEVRRRLLETKHLYTQAAAFVDGATLWSRRRSMHEGLRNAYWSVGGGVRFAYKRFPRIGRFDLAFNTKTATWAYYLTASQFF